MEPLRILIVDDEPHILDAYALALGSMGYEVKTAHVVSDALRLIAAEKFDVVFLDHYLGADRGVELMTEMRRMDPDLYFVIITGNGTTELAVESLKLGASDYISKPFFLKDMAKSIDYVIKKRDLDLQKRDLVATLESKISEKTKELDGVYFDVLSTLAQAMEKKDTGTYGHCRRVCHYSRLISGALDFSERDREMLKTAAMLHDIGKIGITDFVLGKPGALTGDEQELIRNHPIKGVEILKPIKQFEDILPTILHHHECYDGSGYPSGLSGEHIPLFARIIAVADTYDAIISNRPYRAGSNNAYALQELIRCAGTQFDPNIVHVCVGLEELHRKMFSYSMLEND